MPVLYRKYRPQRFAEVVGQEAIIQTLQQAVDAGTVAHAYLFTGSRGVGKTSVARILAKAINCQKPTKGDADGTCEICQAIADNNFLDLVEIDAASNTGVENVRELIEHVRFKPSLGKYKVFIIDEVHMLSKAAFNALLKTLEEPPEHAVFVLATTDIHKVPETIISRTQRFDFRKLSESAIVKHLGDIAKKEKLKINDDVLALIANSAQGGLRDALSLLDKVSALGSVDLAEAQAFLGITSVKLSQQLVDLIAGKQTAQLPAVFDELLVNGTDFTVLNRDLLEYLRKLLVYKVAGEETVINLLPEDLKVLQNQAQKMALPEIMHVIRLFLRSYKEIAQAPSPELPLLLAAIEAAGAKSSAVKVEPVASPSVNSRTQSSASSEPSAQVSLLERIMTESKSSSVVTDMEQGVTEETIALDLDPITREEVEGFWNDLVEKVKAVNSPLATLVKNSPLQNVDNSTITIGVKYLFHKEHLESKKNYALLTGFIKDLCGKNVRLSVKIVKQDDEPVYTHSMDAIGDALKVFGGELVE